ncbi:hypothetical protein QFZ66_005310 [Streptomyces sp. B4I13]|nr:hypothetical protein [Streptomyces sp. B4I13]
MGYTPLLPSGVTGTLTKRHLLTVVAWLATRALTLWLLAHSAPPWRPAHPRPVPRTGPHRRPAAAGRTGDGPGVEGRHRTRHSVLIASAVARASAPRYPLGSFGLRITTERQ